ncbi:hypothetical protein [Anaerorhabdus sp.]|uniref:hypothetical protein n=1 Tax=Anaerorhabdus sp. TaxID=1872524 RepID=UPI002FC75E1D
MTAKVSKSFFEKPRPHVTNEVLKNDVVKINWSKEVVNRDKKVFFSLSNSKETKK